jgi:hypothetical protein
MSLSTPQQVLERLSEIDEALALRMNDYETAAHEKATLTRDWDKRLAIHMRLAKGSNEATRKANALTAAIEQDNLYDRLTEAEGEYEACRVVVRMLENRATLGMAILKSQGRS